MDRFELNSKIELITEDGRMTYGLIYDTGEDKVYVSIPPDDRSFIILQIGEILESIVYLEEETVEFKCIVTDRICGSTPMYELSELGNFMKVQRREDVRISYTRAIQYTGNKYLFELGQSERDPRETLENIERHLEDGMMMDLSGGGLKFSCYDDFEIGEILLVIFNLGRDTFMVKCGIRDKELDVYPKRTKYIYGVEFEDIDEKSRDEIIRFIFILMRKTQNKIIK
ncbi:flagellar brake protein [Tissierellaceae bacterium HCP3S3_D8]